MKEIIISIKRAPYQSLAAFMVLFFTLFLSVILFVSMSFLYGFLGYIETRPQVTAYFQPKTPESDIFSIREQLLNSGKVLSIKYITKNEAFQVYKNLNKDNPLLLEMVSADILPSSLEIYAKKPSYLPEIASFLKKQGGIDEVNYQKDIVDRLLTLTNILRKITIGFFIFLILMSIIVLTTTTLFKIAMKKDEIELLRLLGATTFYIKKPFLIEGILYGLTASLTTCAIIIGIILYFNPFISSYFKGISTLTVHLSMTQLIVWPLNPLFFVLMFSFSSLFGISIAIISSLLATNKYLK
jgi:cell division transport system permease protein